MEGEVKRRAEEHATLLEKLSKLDYAPSALKDNEELLKRLDEDLKERKEYLVGLERQTQSELKDVSTIKRSSTRRLFHRISQGKRSLEKRIQKEEQEYIDAYKMEQATKESITLLEEERDKALKANGELVKSASQHAVLKEQLDGLYDRVFGGDSPDFPEEDEAEKKFQLADEAYKAAQSELNRDSQAHSLLTRAETVLRGWQREAGMNRRRSSDASTKIEVQFETLVDQARSIQPLVRDLVPNGKADLTTSATKLREELLISDKRLANARLRVNEATVTMQARRAELEEIRRRLFVEVAQGKLQRKEITALPAWPAPFDDAEAKVSFEGVGGFRMPGSPPRSPNSPQYGWETNPYAAKMLQQSWQEPDPAP